MSRCGELLAREPRLAAIYSDRASALAGYGLITLYTTAMIWVGMWLGLIVRSPDTARGDVPRDTFVALAGLGARMISGRCEAQNDP